MNWLRRVLGMHNAAPPAHVKAAEEAVAAANDSFADGRAAVAEYDKAVGRVGKARDRILQDYATAEAKRRAR